MGAIVAVHVGSLTPVFPNALTTGVPPGTVLTPHVGDMNINTANTVISGLHMMGQFIVRAPGVVIKNCLIDGWGTFAISTPETVIGTPLTIQDCEIGPPSFTDPHDPNHADGATQILEVNFIARRLNMHGSENGFSIDSNAVVEDCWVHDMNNKGVDNHTDCIQFADGVHDVIVRNNRFESMGPNASGVLVDGTSCIISPPQANNGGVHDIVIDGNYFAGGGFCVYGPQGGTGTNVQITNNVFSTQFFPDAGKFAAWTDAVDENVVSNNRWFPDGRLVPASGLFRDTI